MTSDFVPNSSGMLETQAAFSRPQAPSCEGARRCPFPLGKLYTSQSNQVHRKELISG